MVYVDFDAPERTIAPKRSAYWYKATIQSQGRNIPYQQPKSWFPTAMAFNPEPTNTARRRMQQQSSLFTESTGNERQRRERMEPPRKELPSRLLIGYGSNVDKVRRAVHDGVNVVIWSFAEITASAHMETSVDLDRQKIGIPERRRQQERMKTSMSTNLNLTATAELISELDHDGYHHVVHLVSFGGWNGPHLDPNLTAAEWWHDGFMVHLGHLFDGIDWDLEGHDGLSSPTNFFSFQTLQTMGEISRLAKNDGYWVGMAPPQSYLLDMVTGDEDADDDDENVHPFSQYVNLTDPTRPWHSHFSYYGAKVYTYLMARYGDYIDFVLVQFYESYSRAADAMFRNHQTPPAYLKRFLGTLSKQYSVQL